MSVAWPCDKCGEPQVHNGYHVFSSKWGCVGTPDQPPAWTPEERLEFHLQHIRNAYTDTFGGPRTDTERAYMLRESTLIAGARSWPEWWVQVVKERDGWPEWHAHMKALGHSNYKSEWGLMLP